MAARDPYDPTVALTTISTISIGIAAIVAGWIALDIIWRRGWKSMMWIMIPVYIINALYLWPITLWTYIQYGRPPPRKKEEAAADKKEAHHPPHAGGEGKEGEAHSTEGGEEAGGCDHHDMGSQRPMFATITVAVCHCGAGCVLGDIVGEWIVWGTNARIAGELLYTEFIVDFVWAIAFGLFFQYFSIAPMAGKWGPAIVWRALQADFLSLCFFEIGLFGWMAAFQVGIFEWRLEMNNVLYWWMMQIGMFLGHWTAVPVNYWLIKKAVKEPCA